MMIMIDWRKLFSIVWLITLSSFSAQAQKTTAQYTITGVIRDSATTKPVAYATVSLLDTAGRFVASSYSLESGTFKVITGQPGAYTIDISFIGYKTRRRSFIVAEGRFLNNIGNLAILPGTENLQEVTITSRKRLVDQKPGMLVYNAENDLANKGGTAADVLRKAPVLNVDAQGNVTMRGSGNLKILINGKYSGQMARSAADALNMMPAAMIKSVEIITTPSAKYDAEGAAGVINIITKKGKSDMSGTLEAGLSNLEQVLNPRLSVSTQKWNINFAGHLHRLRSKSTQVLDRRAFSGGEETRRLQQVIDKDNAAPHGSADLSIDYALNETSELSLGLNAWLGKWPEDAHTNSTMRTPDGAIIEHYLQDITQSGNYLGMDINLGYTKRLKRPGQQISLLVQNSPSRDRSGYDAVQSAISKELLYRELNRSTTRNREWTLQADYVQPLNTKGTLHLESGAKAIFRNVGNRYEVSASDPVQTGNIIPQPDRSDYFKYGQDVLAGYSMLKASLKNNWYVEGGARVEATYIKGTFLHTGTAFNNEFVNFVPTATLTKKIDESNTLNLSYTRRLTRPYIWDLNPNANASDPKNIESGNPRLKPEMVHQAELSYSLNTNRALFVNTALFWKQTDNAIVDFTETNAEGISTTSKQNLASNRQLGLNFSLTASISERWTVNGNANVNYTHFNSGALDIFRSGWGTDININSSYKFRDNYSVQAFGEYNTRSVTLLGSLGSMYYYSFAARKEFKKTRTSLTIAAVNPFANYVSQKDIKERPAFSSVVDNRYYNRSFKVTLSWEFGGIQKEQKERKKIENNDIKVQGKG